MENPTIYKFSNINRDTAKRLFQLKQQFESPSLFLDWTAKAATFDLTPFEQKTLALKQHKLNLGVDAWNEQELHIKFISAVLELVDFDMYNIDIHAFAERTLSTKIAKTTIQGNVDWMVATGEIEPRQPFFFIHEYKRSLKGSGDPLGQLLSTMYVAQTLNQEPAAPTLFDQIPKTYENMPIYGCYIVGKTWRFVTLKNKEYYLSTDYNATKKEDLYKIVKLLKAQKQMIIERVINNSDH